MHPPYGFAPTRPTKPPAITTVVLMEALAIVFCLVETAVGLYIMVKTLSQPGDPTSLVVMTCVDAGINVLLVVGLGAAAILLHQGRPAGRVLSWVTCIGYTVARCGCGGFSSLMGILYRSGEIERSDFNFGPSVWYVLGALELVAIALASVIVVVLLTRPVRQYFTALRQA